MSQTDSERSEASISPRLTTEEAALEDLVRQLAAAPVHTIGAALVSGAVVDGRLRIERLLGRGGMGVVYLAYHEQLSRHVAVKLTHAGGTEKATARLLREARAMASINHDNVVTVYDVGTVDSQVFIAMEFVDGGTLRTWLIDKQRTWLEIVNAYLKAGRGLAAAHARGVVHRDFKPDNVLVGVDGRIRVADFGIAPPERRSSRFGRSSGDPARGGRSPPRTGSDRRGRRLWQLPHRDRGRRWHARIHVQRTLRRRRTGRTQ